ncbi:hypothetical protein [Acinetobacter guerrae]|uniref:hypothetical protein n=2 Tax=Acinetobacter TaxID=469 RepID=UPI00125EC326|nr:hypothetical protein [Acinetobacter guerrae]
MQNINHEEMQQLDKAVQSVGRPDFVSDVVTLDDVQIDVKPIPLVMNATEQQLTTQPSNDAVFINLMDELSKSDLTLDDLYRLKEYAEQMPERHYGYNVLQVTFQHLPKSFLST